MFKKAKRKIVISILAILCTVLVGTLGMIYLSSYLSVTNQNYKVLEKRAEIIMSEKPEIKDAFNGKKEDTASMGDAGNPAELPGPEAFPAPMDDVTSSGNERPKGDFRNMGRIERNLEISTFYAVKISSDGSASVLENGADSLYSDEELIAYAKDVQDETKGSEDDLLYLVKESEGNTFVCFMDNTVFTDSFTRLFLYTLLFGLIAIVAITVISVHIAKRIVSPMEDNYKKQKQFTADAGHELKTPIAAMAANIELLSREIGENKWIDNISYENNRMKELVTELLELARNENVAAQRKTTDLSHLVNGAILPMEASAFEKNVLIESEIEDEIHANIDEKGISQLVTILVDNAISHTKHEEKETGKITVSLKEKKGSAILTVSNPGDEIPEEEREKLFERFYRTDSSHEFTGHYGLGLAIAKAIADANEARITVTCNMGVVSFVVELPIR